MLMMHLVGMCLIVLLGIVMTINGAFMLTSPRAWFGLPRWLGLHGSFTKEKYSTGWGAIEVRLTGALTLAAIAWVLYDMFLGSNYNFLGYNGTLGMSFAGACLFALLGLVLTINAAFMLLSPRRWFRLPNWLGGGHGTLTEDRYGTGWGAIQVRIMGALGLVIVGWALYIILTSYF
jgi:hypothetical protein